MSDRLPDLGVDADARPKGRLASMKRSTWIVIVLIVLFVVIPVTSEVLKSHTHKNPTYTAAETAAFVRALQNDPQIGFTTDTSAPGYVHNLRLFEVQGKNACYNRSHGYSNAYIDSRTFTDLNQTVPMSVVTAMIEDAEQAYCPKYE